MENSDNKLIRVKGKRLEKLQLLLSSYENTPVERPEYTVLANEVRWLMRKEFNNFEELKTTYKAMEDRHLAFNTRLRNKILKSIERSQSIRENSRT